MPNSGWFPLFPFVAGGGEHEAARGDYRQVEWIRVCRGDKKGSFPALFHTMPQISPCSNE